MNAHVRFTTARYLMFIHKGVCMNYGMDRLSGSKNYSLPCCIPPVTTWQQIFIYIGSVSIKFVSRRFAETHSLTNEQATVEIKHSHLTGRNLE